MVTRLSGERYSYASASAVSNVIPPEVSQARIRLDATLRMLDLRLPQEAKRLLSFDMRRWAIQNRIKALEDVMCKVDIA
jgi:hypothetical protein